MRRRIALILKIVIDFDNIDNKRAKQRQKELAGTRPNKKSDLKENLPEGNKGQSRDKIA